MSAICSFLAIPRSSYYYKAVDSVSEMDLEEKVSGIFSERKSRYGARNIKQAFALHGICLSRRRIRSIMKRLNLVSVYQKATFKHHSKRKNEAPILNHLVRNFDQRQPLEVMVTDLTYIRVGSRWVCVCFIIDLYKREIIGLSVGGNKTAESMKQALQSIPYALTKV